MGAAAGGARDTEATANHSGGEFMTYIYTCYLLYYYNIYFLMLRQECAHRFPVPLYENEGKKTEKFILNVSPDQLKAVLTLTGDAITQAVSFP